MQNICPACKKGDCKNHVHEYMNRSYRVTRCTCPKHGELLNQLEEVLQSMDDCEVTKAQEKLQLIIDKRKAGLL